MSGLFVTWILTGLCVYSPCWHGHKVEPTLLMVINDRKTLSKKMFHPILNGRMNGAKSWTILEENLLEAAEDLRRQRRFSLKQENHPEHPLI